MKTLDEIIKDYALECGNLFGGNVCAMDIEGVKEVARRFAKHIAQQALENAYNSINSKDVIEIEWSNIHKSITNPDNIPRL